MKRILIILIVLAGIAGVVALKKSRKTEAAPLPVQMLGLPRLLDLGSKECTACKLLVPELEQLKTAYEGRLQVDFIDVWKNEQAATDYDIEIIPVQIFFDIDGHELYRHEGFISKEDIVAKFRELGIDLDA